ncbi:MAG: hypothetical protein QOK19_2333 [Solirubrobacteraceae bacterium]|jgi:hypothetical protein|nr:hypothetical protein [Solirubrobacterales bacterium]MEA2216772.1 hypothetical protein [Solirubrobacteraceae bacterium]
MLLLLIIPAVWGTALVLVAGLCFTAKIGDSELSRDRMTEHEADLAAPVALAVPHGEPQAGAERAHPARGARELAA